MREKKIQNWEFGAKGCNDNKHKVTNIETYSNELLRIYRSTDT